MKRFWRSAAAAPASGGFRILLDGKDVRLPGGAGLIVPYPALAEAIATEWAEAGGAAQNFTPDDLPLTRLASTAQARIPAHRDGIIAQLAAFGRTDLLCYRAENQPDLATRQNQLWQPWLDWAGAEFGADLSSTGGITPVDQPPRTLNLLQTRLAAMTDDHLAGLGVIVPALGSLVLGLALQAGALMPAAACDLAHLDELWQERHWGEDTDARQRRDKILEDVAVAARFMVLCTA